MIYIIWSAARADTASIIDYVAYILESHYVYHM